MDIRVILVCAAGYLFGSIPSALWVIQIFKRGTLRRGAQEPVGLAFALRAGGLLTGLVVLGLDVLKGVASVYLAQAVLPSDDRALGMALAGLSAMLGHSYSIFTRTKTDPGLLPFVGVALLLWPGSVLIAVPLGLIVLFWLRKPVLITAGVPLAVTALLAYAAYANQAPYQYVAFGLGALALLVWRVRDPLLRTLRSPILP